MAFRFLVDNHAGEAGATHTTLTNGNIGGSGGTATQATDKSTGVAIEGTVGKITLNAASLAAGAIVGFTLTNTLIKATDLLLVAHVSGGTSGAYIVNAFPSDGSAVISVRNTTAGALAEAIVIRFLRLPSSDS